MKKYLKTGLIALATILVLGQFIRPEKNLSADINNDITKAFIVPDSIQNILKTSCYDCHSNKTVYPWYAEVQPVAWWLSDHVGEGKREVNFNEFASYKPRRQFKKFTEIIEQEEEDEMPLKSYTIIHRNAVMSPEKKAQLIAWAQAMKDTMSAHYPADSLVMKKR